MPWKETCAMELRREFALKALEEDQSFASLCREFGISRKTGYKWMERFGSEGVSGLVDGRTTRTQHLRYCSDVYHTVLDLRRFKPNWGPKKLSAYLRENFSDQLWPSPSTIKVWLRKNGLSKPSYRRRFTSVAHVGRRLPPTLEPNDVWCADYKGVFRTGDRTRCEPLTAIDGASRYFLTCHIGETRQFKDIKIEFERLFAEYGKPAVVLTDNGAPFGSPGLASLSPFTVWLIEQGVWPEKTRPAHPQDNGRLERLHRTLKHDTATPPAKTLRLQKMRFERFRNEYNNERPHEALGLRTPASLYTPGVNKNRPYYEYPDSMQTLRVDNKGYLKWGGDKIYLSETLGKQYVGVVEDDNHRFRIEFLGYPIAIIDETRQKRTL